MPSIIRVSISIYPTGKNRNKIGTYLQRITAATRITKSAIDHLKSLNAMLIVFLRIVGTVSSNFDTYGNQYCDHIATRTAYTTKIIPGICHLCSGKRYAHAETHPIPTIAKINTPVNSSNVACLKSLLKTFQNSCHICPSCLFSTFSTV